MAHLDQEHYQKFERMNDLNPEELLEAIIMALDTDKANEVIDWVWTCWDMDEREDENRDEENEDDEE